MNRDISQIADDLACYALPDNQTIVGYDGYQAFTYHIFGNKYYLSTTDDYSGMPTKLECYTYQEIESLPIQYDIITPFYHALAITSAILIFYIAYKLILYPFFRTRL